MSSAKTHAEAPLFVSPARQKPRLSDAVSSAKTSVNQEPSDLHPKPKKTANFQLRCILPPRAHLHSNLLPIDITSIDPNPASLFPSPSPSPAPNYHRSSSIHFRARRPLEGFDFLHGSFPRQSANERTSPHSRTPCPSSSDQTHFLPRPPLFFSPSLPRNPRIGQLLFSSHRNPDRLISALRSPKLFSRLELLQTSL